MKGVFQHAFTQNNVEMAAIVEISGAKEGDGFYAMVERVGFDEEENSLEPLKSIWDGAPEFVKSGLRKMEFSGAMRTCLQINGTNP